MPRIDLPHTFALILYCPLSVRLGTRFEFHRLRRTCSAFFACGTRKRPPKGRAKPTANLRRSGTCSVPLLRSGSPGPKVINGSFRFLMGKPSAEWNLFGSIPKFGFARLVNCSTPTLRFRPHFVRAQPSAEWNGLAPRYARGSPLLCSGSALASLGLRPRIG